jgi:hypothetical protein
MLSPVVLTFFQSNAIISASEIFQNTFFKKIGAEFMKIVVLSDTHIPKRAKSLPSRSPTDKRRQERYSFGILHIGESLEAKHIFFG